MDAITAIRHQNLCNLIKTARTQSEFAQKAALAPAYVSQLALKNRGIGERTARKLEVRLKLPKGWMDIDHTQNI